jgi:tetratricopeptide (TPR) repeat protein
VVYYFQRDWDRALEYYFRAHQMDPELGLTAANVGVVYANLGQLDSAAVWLDSAVVLEPNEPGWREWQIHFAHLRGDSDEARRLNEAVRRSQSADPYWLSRTSTIDWLLDVGDGRIAEGESSYAAAMDANEVRGGAAPLATSLLEAELALALARPGEAVRLVEAALAAYPLDDIPPLDRPTSAVASILARAGDVATAREILAAQREELGPLADRTRLGFEVADAWVDVAEGRFADAIPALRDADEGYGCQPCADQAVGRAFDLWGRPDSAAVYYEKYLTPAFNFRTWVDGLWKGWTLERLGQLYDEMGESEKAAGYYGMFVDLWSDADPGLQPRVRAARERMEEIVRERG